jgi:hypothetical protein
MSRRFVVIKVIKVIHPEGVITGHFSDQNNVVTVSYGCLTPIGQGFVDVCPQPKDLKHRRSQRQSRHSVRLTFIILAWGDFSLKSQPLTRFFL